MTELFPETRRAWLRLKRAVADCIVAYVDPEAASAKKRLATYEGVAERWGKLTITRISPEARGDLVGQPGRIERISREEAEKRWPKAPTA